MVEMELPNPIIVFFTEWPHQGCHLYYQMVALLQALNYLINSRIINILIAIDSIYLKLRVRCKERLTLRTLGDLGVL